MANNQQFILSDLTDMILIIGECRCQIKAAKRLYQVNFPNRRQPSRQVFRKVLHRFRTTGSVSYIKRKKNEFILSEEHENNVILSVVDNPNASTYSVADDMNVSQSTVSRILRKHKYHPYHLCLNQELHGEDFQNRVNFCTDIQMRLIENESFLKNILYTDEASFKSNGALNRHNMHYYSTVNPYWMRTVDNQRVWSLNVWGGIIGTHVVGPHFFDGTLTGAIYLDFLRNDLPTYLEEVPLQVRQDMWYHHDGAPPHYAHHVRDYLDQTYPNRWIGRGGNISWPARSPDLTPCDFFLWGYVKEQVYVIPPTTIEEMKNRIRNVFYKITTQTLLDVMENNQRRLQLCIEQNGNTFEHLRI